MNTERMREEATEIRASFPAGIPLCGVVLGSGWAETMKALSVEKRIDYTAISCLGRTGVDGHAGELVLARIANQPVLIFHGRRHWYEGVGWEPIAMPIVIARAFEVDTILLTNASGGIAEHLSPGDLMVIDDHINMMGANPLVGSHDPYWGMRFPDQTRVYSSELGALLDRSAGELDLTVQHGIYAAVSGPVYETPAEVRALAALGADAVGMSTVPEAILANAAGLRVAAVSCIANGAAGNESEDVLSHSAVLEAVRSARPQMARVLQRFLEKLVSSPNTP